MVEIIKDYGAGHIQQRRLPYNHRPWGVAERESLKLPVAEMRNVKCGVRFGQVRGTEHVLGMELILFARPV